MDPIVTCFLKEMRVREETIQWTTWDGDVWTQEVVWQRLKFCTSLESFAKMFPDGMRFIEAANIKERAERVVTRQEPNPSTGVDPMADSARKDYARNQVALEMKRLELGYSKKKWDEMRRSGELAPMLSDLHARKVAVLEEKRLELGISQEKWREILRSGTLRQVLERGQPRRGEGGASLAVA
jgi:hypothetical protein